MTYQILKKQEAEELIFKLFEGMKKIKTVHEQTVAAGTTYMDVWEWPQGVGLFALYQYYKETNKKNVLDYIVGWFDLHIKKGLPVKNVNTMCPMLTLTYIYEETGKEEYLELCKEWLYYAMEEMPRTIEGGIQHITTSDINDQQLWDDTLYMTVLFIARMGILLKEDRYVQESITQFMVHLKYLTDVKTGLFFHGWTFIEKNHFANALWARGNSWYTAGLVDYLDMIEVPEGVKNYLITSLERQVEKLSELQTEEGMWHTLLDHPDSYVETSATAAFAYGILKAVRKGYIDGKYEETGYKALKAVIGYIDSEGVVQSVSYGTGMGDTLQFYKDVPLCPQVYGQSMVMMLLSEAIKHL